MYVHHIFLWDLFSFLYVCVWINSQRREAGIPMAFKTRNRAPHITEKIHGNSRGNWDKMQGFFV